MKLMDCFSNKEIQQLEKSYEIHKLKNSKEMKSFFYQLEKCKQLYDKKQQMMNQYYHEGILDQIVLKEWKQSLIQTEKRITKLIELFE